MARRRVRGPDHDRALKIVDRSDLIVTRAVRAVLRRTAATLGSSALRASLAAAAPAFEATPDDLASLSMHWAEEVDDSVMDFFITMADDASLEIIDNLDEVFPELGGSIPQLPIATADSMMLEARNRLVNVSDHIWDVARTELAAGINHGESIDQLRDRIVHATNIAAPRATTIARTEAIGVMNASSLHQVQFAGFRGIKEWVDTPDNRTRPTHRIAAGQVVPLGDKFRVGGSYLSYPGDHQSGDAGEIVNCRCTMTYDLDPPYSPALVASVRRLRGHHWFCKSPKHPGPCKRTPDEEPAEHKPKKVAAPKVETSSPLHRAIASGEASREQIGMSDVDRVTFNDGTVAIVRRHPAPNELASQHMSGVLNAPVANGVTHNGTLYQEHVNGQTASEYSTRALTALQQGKGTIADYMNDQEHLKNVIKSDAGKQLGVYDYITGQSDRHTSNWFVRDDGSITGIDHDLSFGKTISPFAQSWASHKFTQAEADDIYTKVASQRDAFVSNGWTAQHDLMMQRATYLRDNLQFNSDDIVPNKLSPDGGPL